MRLYVKKDTQLAGRKGEYDRDGYRVVFIYMNKKRCIQAVYRMVAKGR